MGPLPEGDFSTAHLLQESQGFAHTPLPLRFEGSRVMPRVKFAPSVRSDFRATLKARVDAHFAQTGRSPHWDWRMAAKVVFYLGGYAVAYALLLQAPHTAAYFVTAAVTGLFIAGIGFNVGHDAAHGAFSSKRWANHVLAHSFTLAGVHVYTWKILHNVIHHSYTNIPHADGDLYSVSLLRFFDDERTPPRPYHRYQHIYAFGLYALATLVWVFRKDFMHMNKAEHCGYVKPKPPPSEWALLYAGKLLHYTLFLVLPVLVTPHSVGIVIAGFLIMHLVAGAILASVFALGHFLDETAIVRSDAAGRIDDDWADHQLRTSANFSTGSALFYWTVGGLNFQIEHHLLPSVCHVHYKELAPIVRRTAAEYGLPYHDHPTVWRALGSHVRFLRRYGSALPDRASLQLGVEAPRVGCEPT